MKVLVTGATGNVGSVVVAELLKRGADVCALIRKPDAAHKLPAESRTRPVHFPGAAHFGSWRARCRTRRATLSSPPSVSHRCPSQTTLRALRPGQIFSCDVTLN
jgi:NAD(P)-dependent dehydrogenase (short-subunit alcohol dehydrogenase family)